MDEKISSGGERCMIMMASWEYLGYVLVFNPIWGSKGCIQEV
jgi:hypothetical protein